MANHEPFDQDVRLGAAGAPGRREQVTGGTNLERA